MQEIELRTGVWYQDRPLRLSFPDDWKVSTFWPDTPAAMSDDEIRAQFSKPIGQPPLWQQAKSTKSPVVIVDDLSRPTPLYRIMPFVLEEFAKAGVEKSRIKVIVATGTHGRQSRDALTRKLGAVTMASCTVTIHDDRRRCRFIGRTSFGTPVFVNRDVLDSDFIIGIGGVYPQHTTGFGGGSKLGLGVLGRKTIAHLHFGHRSVGGTYNVENDFRRDLDEIAAMIRLKSLITAHVDSRQQLVALLCGDHFAYYSKAVAFSRDRYDAPAADEYDLVIANAYPSDVSFFFMRKSMKPLHCAPRSATKVIVSSNHGGLGRHGLYQPGKNKRLNDYRTLYARLSTRPRRELLAKALRRLAIWKRPVQSRKKNISTTPSSNGGERVYLYTPPGGVTGLSRDKSIIEINAWDDVIELARREHRPRNYLNVAIYPCASLQCIESRAINDVRFEE